jgi:predicted ATPase
MSSITGEDCGCTHHHEPHRIVLTGGPGAGKTAVLELVRQAMCRHVEVLPESAGILFGGGFPRRAAVHARRAAQRAIFHVQRELETATLADDVAILLCDRGTIDSAAYWPGPDEIWPSVGTTLDDELARYHAVIHLRVPSHQDGYNRDNPLRVETADEAAAIDERIARAWAPHPRRHEVPATPDFVTKATRALDLIRAELSPCCVARARVLLGAVAPAPAQDLAR